MAQPILTLENINKKVSDFFSLKNICLELYPGEVHVLMGENGSGKSTLMGIISGTYAKDSGSMVMEGCPVSIHSPMDAKKLGITMIHQDSSLFEHFSVAENIYFSSNPHWNKGFRLIHLNRMYADCQQLFEKLGFPLNSKSIVRDLSLAQKKLVEVAKAYLSNARIIIMDEPSSSFTDAECTLLCNIIKELKKTGVSIFFISHRLDEIRRLGDRITVIRDGEIAGTQDICNMDVDHILRMMTGFEPSERYPKLNIHPGREILQISGLCSGHTLQGISFSLRRREILGVTGLVGSGRTQIAKCLFGLDEAGSGEIFIENTKMDIKSPADAIRAGIGYVTEDRSTEGLFMYLNIPQNITAPSIAKVSNRFLIHRGKEKSIAGTYVEKLGIKIGTIKDKVAHLSGGNQQKVVLAKWIMSRAKIFILDEPTRDIDIPSKVDVYNLMNEMVSKGASIILISSDVDEIIGMCDRVMVLYGGRIAAILPRTQATQEKILFYATGGKAGN